MSTLELFTTRAVPTDRRQQYWRTLVAETFPGMMADVPVGIRADLARWSMGQLSVARAQSDRARVARAPMLKDDRNLVFHLQRRGSMMMVQGNRIVSVGKGDVLIADESIPYTIDISDDNDCLIVRIPARLLGDATVAREWNAHRLDGRDVNTALLARMLEGLWAERSQSEDVEAGMDEVIGGMARIACLRSVRGGPARDPLRQPIDYALAYLDDPSLSTAQIATATGLSMRTVQKAFARHLAVTPSAFITDQRLIRSARALKEGDDRSITQIAFDVGFSDAAFFSRCFRRRFGITPSEWRRR